MEQIENEFLSPSDFYSQLEITVKTRIAELLKTIQELEYIERDRGLSGFQRAKKVVSGRALTTNENFMIHFDRTYTKYQ